ncbi:MAG: amidase family protein, partial [Chloroflexota bacterium]
AQEGARQGDALRASGASAPLLGLPITIKDAIDVEGLPTTSGLVDRRDRVAPSDAPAVAALRRGGAIIMGKTNVPPRASDWQTSNELFGRTNNPWDSRRTPGGSTGGGAAAIAAGLSPLELGSDIGGSIRVPAAFCGVYGHRPSDGLVPRGGHVPGPRLPNPGTVLNVLGPLSRSAGDLDLALRVLAVGDRGEDAAWKLEMLPPRHTSLREFRIAIMPELEWLPLARDVRLAMTRVSERLRALGATVEVSIPEGFGDCRQYHRVYTSLLAAIFNFNTGLPEELRYERVRELRDTGDEFDVARAEGLLASAQQFLEWLDQREEYRERYQEFFRRWDVLLAPITLTPAFPHDDSPFAKRVVRVDGQDIPYERMSVYPGLATLTGQPATAFPAGQSADRLPIGLQAIGPYLEDRTPIAFAALLAEEIGGFVPPPGFD